MMNDQCAENERKYVQGAFRHSIAICDYTITNTGQRCSPDNSENCKMYMEFSYAFYIFHIHNRLQAIHSM